MLELEYIEFYTSMSFTSRLVKNFFGYKSGLYSQKNSNSLELVVLNSKSILHEYKLKFSNILK